MQVMPGFASSPLSNEAASHDGTPETRLTAFSPDGARVSNHSTPNRKINHQNGRSTISGASGKTIYLSSAGDPFIASSFGGTVGGLGFARSQGLRLSPTATDFQPSTVPMATPTMSAVTPTIGPVFTPTTTASGGASAGLAHTGVSFLNATSTPLAKGGNSCQQSVEKQGIVPKLSPIGHPLAPDTNDINSGLFTIEDCTSRAFVIEGINTFFSPTDLEHFFGRNYFPSVKGFVFKELEPKGTIYVAYADVRDAVHAYEKGSQQTHWSVRYIKPQDFVAKDKPELLSYASEHEGEVIVTACSRLENADHLDFAMSPDTIKRYMDNFGTIKAFRALVPRPGRAVNDFHVEFHDVRSAYFAVRSLDTTKFKGFVVSVAYYHPEQPASHPYPKVLVYGNLTPWSPHGLVNGMPTCKTPKMSADRIAAQLKETELTPRIIRAGRGILDNILTSPLTLASPSRGAVIFPLEDVPISPLTVSPHGAHAPKMTQASGQWHHISPTGRSYVPVGANKTQPTSDVSTLIAAQVATSSPLTPNFAVAIQPAHIALATPQTRGAIAMQQNRGSAHPRAGMRSTTKTGGRGGHDPLVQHNTVNLDRIASGADVRTTIMLRNIPNKIDQAMLKNIIDETSYGKYDFMYLRIDFANNCNVGYAFINFEDPYYIIPFVNLRAGQRWNRFNSDKVAEVSYATIQGKDCLVQKFRNSSVMLEHPSFRPKIFHTGTGPLAGSEETFPGPDNPSKMRRSVENAEHVGLFAPRAGQQFRDEQRRRRSHFDRGTRLAQIEAIHTQGHGWIEGCYYVVVPGTGQIVRAQFAPRPQPPAYPVTAPSYFG